MQGDNLFGCFVSACALFDYMRLYVSSGPQDALKGGMD
jgi:hypothetical protein